MDKTNPALSFAEWTLAAVSSRERAAEVVGDHLEQHGSVLSLWTSVLRIGFAKQWRWLVALPVAALVGSPTFASGTTMWIAKDFARGFADGVGGSAPAAGLMQPTAGALMVGAVLAGVAVCLWSVAALALVRYGLRSPIARLGGGLAVLFTIGSCCVWGQHGVAFVLPGLGVAVALVFANAQARRVLSCVTMAGVAFWGAFLVVSGVVGRIALIGGAREVAAVTVAGYVFCLLIEACALAQGRRWLRLA